MRVEIKSQIKVDSVYLNLLTKCQIPLSKMVISREFVSPSGLFIPISFLLLKKLKVILKNKIGESGFCAGFEIMPAWLWSSVTLNISSCLYHLQME